MKTKLINYLVASIIEEVKERILNDYLTGDMHSIEVKDWGFDVDYKGSYEVLKGMRSFDYDTPNDADRCKVTIDSIEVRDVWSKDGKVYSNILKALNNKFYNLF